MNLSNYFFRTDSTMLTSITCSLLALLYAWNQDCQWQFHLPTDRRMVGWVGRPTDRATDQTTHRLLTGLLITHQLQPVAVITHTRLYLITQRCTTHPIFQPIYLPYLDTVW